MDVYQKGDKVVCGCKGVCCVEDITTLNMQGIDRERLYYILKPVYMPGSTVYLPVDTADSTMRSILTREEVEELIQRIPQIPEITTINDKLLEQEYKTCLKTDQCDEWVRILKTIYNRKRKRQAVGRKVTAVDTRYARIAADCLYGELAICLDIPREEVEDYIGSCLA